MVFTRNANNSTCLLCMATDSAPNMLHILLLFCGETRLWVDPTPENLSETEELEI